MENRKWSSRAASFRSLAPPFDYHFLFSICCFFLLAGCGAPGEPTPPRQVVPQAVSDLTVRQLGDGVVLTFTLPKKAVDGVKLEGPPAVEIYRNSPAAGGKPNAARLVYTIPAAMVNDSLIDGQIEFRDPLPQEDVSSPAGQSLSYFVRTRASKKRASADSNAVTLRVFPPPAPPTLLHADITETAMALTWTYTPAAESPGGEFAGFHVYRAEIAPGDVEAARTDPKFKLNKPLTLLGPSPDPQFRDAQSEFGHAYYYIVRAVARYGTQEVESSDSRSVSIQANDVFPPAPPRNVVAILVPAMGDSPAHIELSWEINRETDLAGYSIYRIEGIDTTGRGERLNRELVLAPTFRDLTAAAGRRFTYRVTAVDRTGNESAPSEAVTIDFPPRVP